MANRVGWFDLNNINCGLLGMPLGFLVIIVVSLFTKAPSDEMQAFIDEIRKPRGQDAFWRKRPPTACATIGSGVLRDPAFFLQRRCRCEACAPSPFCRRLKRATIRGQSHSDLLVFSAAELHSGGADVHAARPRAAWACSSSRTRRTTSGASSAASPTRWSQWSHSSRQGGAAGRRSGCSASCGCSGCGSACSISFFFMGGIPRSS